MPSVVYLTGSPAVGKSSLGSYFIQHMQNIELFEYGKELTRYLNAKNKTKNSQSDIRTKSSGVITAADVRYVDKLLTSFIESKRKRKNVIIDTHAVTKESYGFRITPFSIKQLRLINPTHIVVV